MIWRKHKSETWKSQLIVYAHGPWKPQEGCEGAGSETLALSLPSFSALEFLKGELAKLDILARFGFSEAISGEQLVIEAQNVEKLKTIARKIIVRTAWEVYQNEGNFRFAYKPIPRDPLEYCALWNALETEGLAPVKSEARIKDPRVLRALEPFPEMMNIASSRRDFAPQLGDIYILDMNSYQKVLDYGPFLPARTAQGMLSWVPSRFRKHL